ncbi:glycoside hydrolase family protein [Natrinema salaciae]|uniref:hypothetical protein n=1 Tax=Natrinema salaciae TaxID=1186196 RepID=UPI000B82A801|nr:hypothetical protein [Natrinema salaciae]
MTGAESDQRRSDRYDRRDRLEWRRFGDELRRHVRRESTVRSDFADPTIYRTDDGTRWTSASNVASDQSDGERLVPILSSSDLVDWTFQGEAFDTRPGWVPPRHLLHKNYG